jgi:hypothetical protein
MIAIVGMRLNGYLRAYHAIAPAIAGLVVLATLYGGGVTRPEEAYGVSALVLFPVLAWQAKILLDAEPDVQRQLIRVAAGEADREIAAGLLAAASAAVPTVALAMIMPWIFRSVGAVQQPGVAAPLGLGAALAVGLWAHLLVIPASIALGGWASRAVTQTRALGVVVLVTGSVLGILLGVNGSPIPFLAPPLMATARAANQGITAAGVFGLSVWSLAWAAVVIVGYWRVRLKKA